MSSVKLLDNLYYGIHPSKVFPTFKINYIIDLTELKEFPDFDLKNNSSIKYIRFPIKDCKAPSIEYLIKIVNKILELDGVIYIACKGGHGRSGMIAACIIGKIKKLSSEDALNLINNEWRAQRDMSYLSPKIKKLGSPQTRVQKNIVRKFLS